MVLEFRISFILNFIIAIVLASIENKKENQPKHCKTSKDEAFYLKLE